MLGLLMPHVEKSVLVNFSSEQIFDLVEDIEKYPEFLPWCGGAAIIERKPHHTIATILINYHGVKHSFTTSNSNDRPRLIEMKLVDGPFKFLNGKWHFLSLNESASKITFDLQYEFSNSILGLVLGPVFHHIAHTFVEAFIRRAKEIYGPHPS